MSKKKSSSVSEKKPVGDRIIVQRDETEEVSPGGVVLPDSAQEKSTRGKVMAAGPGRVLANGALAPMECDIGDTIVFAQRAYWAEVQIDGEDYIVMSAADVLYVD